MTSLMHFAHPSAHYNMICVARNHFFSLISRLVPCTRWVFICWKKMIGQYLIIYYVMRKAWIQ